MTFKSIRGTKDILPGDTEQWQFVEAAVRRVFHWFNYKEIRTPLFEQTALFSRSIGALTDIVGKEMYTFTDRSEESLTLRPEGTASVIRAYLQHNLGESLPLVKVYYLGPMFRQERPQAGRLRQFHQFGAEAIGSAQPETDAEIIALTVQIYRELSINQFVLKINSVGCEKCRPHYKEVLRAELKKIASKLSPDSQRRIEENPMRVLDSKDENDRALTAHMPMIMDYLCPECADHFEKLKKCLNLFQLPFEIDGRLVRGLDYYTKTAFELTSNDLGSQDALAGGGRYDLLAQELGGKATPGVGFAAGFERLLMVLEKKGIEPVNPVAPLLYLAAAEEASRDWVMSKTMELRAAGLAVEADFLSRSLKAQMRDADRQKALFVAVVGQQELTSGTVSLKEMNSGKTHEVDLAGLAQWFSKRQP
ncbi:MAG TPA: histidine--tRNA ligase [Bacteroidota bacterium]|nr:histidine--tRNA ligase [Bacteroidota bacterium]